jgi:hypothetical protein
MSDRPFALPGCLAFSVTAIILAAAEDHDAGPVNGPAAPVAATGSATHVAYA